jgi:hypothetical protein
VLAVAAAADFSKATEPLIWLGATDAAAEGTWYWTADGSRLIDQAYSNWNPSEPNGMTGENCMALSGKSWIDKYCFDSFPSVCQRKHPYVLVNSLKTFAGAEAHCRSLGGSLAKVSSAEDQRTLLAVAAAADFSKATEPLIWLGATDAAAEGTWKWTADGSDLAGQTYLNWNPSEPNGMTGENCMALSGTSWIDKTCFDSFPFVCQAPKAQPPKAQPPKGQRCVRISRAKADKFKAALCPSR